MTADIPMIAIRVFIAKILDIWLKASIMNGTFIMKNRIANGISVVWATSSEMPQQPSFHQ